MTARAITYYLDVSAECTRRIIAIDGAVKAICNRLVVSDFTSRTSKDLAEQCIKVSESVRGGFRSLRVGRVGRFLPDSVPVPGAGTHLHEGGRRRLRRRRTQLRFIVYTGQRMESAQGHASLRDGRRLEVVHENGASRSVPAGLRGSVVDAA